MSKYKELVLLKSANIKYLAILPTGIATEGDVAVVDGSLFEVEKTEWINEESETYSMILATCDIVKPDKILRQKWSKEEDDVPA